MSSILSIAISGLNNATTRIANAASNIVNASSTPAASKNAGNSAAVDLNAELVNGSIAKVEYGANAAVIKVENKLEKSLVDIKT